MISENIKALIKYRIEQAEESLKASKVLLENNLFRPSLNRSYYAMFYAVLALLVIEKKETSKHSGAISIFDKEFIKKNMFTKEFSKWLHEAFDMRQRSDYSAGYTITKEDAEKILDRAIPFVKEIKSSLERRR